MHQGFSPSDHPPLSISRLIPADLRQTSSLHRSLLPNGFLPQLGNTFVRRWHRTFIDSSHGAAFVAKDKQGQIQGFVLASTDQARYTADVLSHNRMALAWRGVFGLAVRPRLAVRFLRSRARHYLRHIQRPSTVIPARSPTTEQSTQASSPNPGGPETAPPATTPVVGVIHAVVTVPSCRGHGVGRALLAAYDRELIALQTPLVQLVTSEAGNAGAFYDRLGYRQTDRRFDRDGMPIIQFDHIPGER